MSGPTLDEMVRTMRAAIDFPSDERLDVALRAVLRKHIEPLIKVAVWHGENRKDEGMGTKLESGTDYATRIIEIIGK